MNDDIDFEYVNGADVNVGCGAMLLGEYWYFGGEKSESRRQVINNENLIKDRNSTRPKILQDRTVRT